MARSLRLLRDIKRKLHRQRCAAMHRPALLEALEERTLLSTLVVTSTADSGLGSLRQAILDANGTPGHDVIAFGLGSGVAQIQPLTALPSLTDEVTIDGTTQPGYSGQPLIWIDGGFQSTGDGLDVLGGNSVIQGLALTSFFNGAGVTLAQGGGDKLYANYIGIDPSGSDTTGFYGNFDGVRVQSDSNAIGGSGIGQGNVIANNSGVGILIAGNGAQVKGNLIGTDATGTLAAPNAAADILVHGAGAMIGGTDAGSRNIISGSYGDGVQVIGATGVNNIQGNYIGLDAGGSFALPNQANGVFISASSVIVTGNVIAANFGDGVRLGDATGCQISGNFIGTDASGQFSLGNHGNGMTLIGTSSNNIIGGTGAGAGNVITGNMGDGVNVAAGSGNAIVGNYIGVGADGITLLGNSGNGVTISASQATIVTGNVIAGNQGNGVDIVAGTGNTIRGNSIYANVLLGIDLGNNGVTVNDTAGHTGPNLYQNYPVITSANVAAPGSLTVKGTLQSTPSSTFTVEFFGNIAPDPSGYGQGQTFLGVATVTTDSTGAASFTATISAPAVGQNYVSATATDAAGNTSEFDQPAAVTHIVAAPPSMSGHTFRDMTGNGLSADDVALGGVTVNVYLERDHNTTLDAGDGAPVATTVSDANGAYSFAGLASGSYYVREVIPSGYVRTAPALSDYYAAALTSSAPLTGLDFDNYHQCTAVITNVTFTIDGKTTVTDLRGHTQQGDTVKANFTVSGTSPGMVTLVSYDAPTASFDASIASQQTIYQVATGVFAPGTYSLTVTLPNNYYQVDFVKCAAIDTLGPAGSNIFYSAQGRLISADNAGLHSDVEDQAASTQFWANLGQTLISSFNVTPTNAAPTTLGNWLAQTFPYSYGCGTTCNLKGATNATVAAKFMQLYKNSARATDAQVLATALNVYASTTSLGGAAAEPFGFHATNAGLGAATFNVLNYGAAFNVANNTTLSVLQMLLATDKKSKNGVLYNGVSSLLSQACTMFSQVNNDGGIV